MQVNISNGTLTQLQETLSPSSGYSLPQSITVTGASQSYNSTTGVLTLTNLTSSVSISATAESAETKNIWVSANQISKAFLGYTKVSKIYLGSSLVYERTPGTVLYTITTSITNGTYSGATNIEQGDVSAIVTLSANSGYVLPNSITVSGASYNYDSTNGVVTLTNFTGNITITAVCETDEPNYLTFSSPSTFTLNVVDNKKYWDGTLYYSTDATTWNEWSGTTTLNSSSSGDTKYLYLRGSGNTYITDSSASSSGKEYWVLTGSNISCDGNIENLLDYQTVANGNHPAMANHCYFRLFNDCTSLTTAPSLPATTLASYCYDNMFRNCTSLTTAPSLPATTLASYCYYYMFYGCKNLTQVPSLPATTLADYCYATMFRGCSKIKLSTTRTGEYTQAYRIPTSGTGTTATGDLDYMFTNTGGTFKGTPTINTTYYLSNTNTIVW